MEPITTALGTWVARQLAQQTVALVTARARRDSDAPEVRKALLLAVKGGLDVAVDDVFPGDPDRQAAVTAGLLERDEDALPLVDGTGLPQLVDVVRVWIAETESPIGDRGLPEHIDRSHPLAAPLCAAILAQVHWDATRGTRALHPLWTDFKLTCLETTASAEPGRLRDYWHPDTTGAGFVGRRPELETLDAALRANEGTGRLQVVAGFGGIGKTELAVAYARAHASTYPDGCVFYDFQSYADGRAPESSDQALVKILPTIRDDLTSAGVEQLSAAGRISAWQQSTAGRSLLMVWDNVKTVEQIEPLLLRQDACATIVTTRDHLELGDASAVIRLDALDPDAARSLFTGIAGTAHDAAVVDRLLEADLYVPVLIKAHAQQVRSGRRGIVEIAEETPHAGPHAKHRTQQALFDRLDGSYRYLDGDRQYAFRFLGAHPGRFVLADTTAAVLSCDAEEAAALMEDLIDVGMAQRHQLRTPGPTAYSAHDVLRAYAAHRALRENEIEPLRSELLAHYRERLRDKAANHQAWLAIEIDNIADTARAGQTRSHADLALEAGHLLFGFGRFTDAAAAYRHAAAHRADADDGLRGHALVGLGEVARLQGEWDDSLEYCKRAVAVFDQAGDRGGLIKAAVGLGHVARLKGRHDEAARYFAQAAEQAAEAGDRSVQARALVGLGHVRRLQRRWDDAVAGFDQAAALGDPLQRANALRGIGDVRRAQDEPNAADALYEQALQTYTALGDRNGEANAYLGRGAVALILEDWEQARRRYQAAEAIFTSLGNRFGLGTALRGMGTAAAGARDPEAARRHLHEALALYASLQSPAVRGLRNQLWELETRFPADAAEPDTTAA
jgi:tetratricopeptide (TPR) repeat protein